MPRSEFQLIQSYFSDPQQAACPDLVLGIGDDCAIIAPREQADLAISIDTLISGVHFPHNTPPDAIAHKALAVNLSDLAAMGAEPAWFTLSLSLPPENPELSHENWLQQFSPALFALAAEHNIRLIGGDTTKGALSITIQVAGYLDKQTGMRRSAAKVDDVIVLTGPLGAASIGLDIVLQQNPENYACLSEQAKQYAVKALNYPQPRIKEGMNIRDIAHSALDLSDGLISDLGHILKASDVGAELFLEQIPLASCLACLDKYPAWEKALTGGDDYELCFTLSQQDWPEIKKNHPQFTAIGVIRAEKSLRLIADDGREYKIHTKGYDHFR